MTTAGWLQFGFVIVLLAISTPLLGSYMAKVYGEEKKAPGDRFFLPVERFIYRVCGVDPDSEQRWTTYALSLIGFSFASLVVLYLQLRVQGHLPLNPNNLGFVRPDLAFNTSVSFLTNTNWQNYSGEVTMTHLSQMAGLAFHNFVSAAAGAAIAVALIRGLVRRRTHTLGNFWVDLVRTTTRVLLPFAFVFALFLMSQGVIQNFHADKTVTTVTGQEQTIPGGPIASQEAIKEIGENGGGPFNANAVASVREPQPDHERVRDLGVARHPVRVHVHVRQDGEGPEAGVGGLRHHVRALGRDDRDRDADGGAREPELHGRRREPVGNGRSIGRQHGRQGGPLRTQRRAACSPRRPPGRRPGRSTASTTVSRRSVARCRWST